MQATAVIAIFAFIILASLYVAPRRASVEGFFGVATDNGQAPGLWTLVFSQVTTWIFARSLMNAAILGFFYGIAGVLAYAAYYGSFLTGGYIVGRMRAQGQQLPILLVLEPPVVEVAPLPTPQVLGRIVEELAELADVAALVGRVGGGDLLQRSWKHIFRS